MTDQIFQLMENQTDMRNQLPELIKENSQLKSITCSQEGANSDIITAMSDKQSYADKLKVNNEKSLDKENVSQVNGIPTCTSGEELVPPRPILPQQQTNMDKHQQTKKNNNNLKSGEVITY